MGKGHWWEGVPIGRWGIGLNILAEMQSRRTMQEDLAGGRERRKRGRLRVVEHYYSSKEGKRKAVRARQTLWEITHLVTSFKHQKKSWNHVKASIIIIIIDLFVSVYDASVDTKSKVLDAKEV